MKTRADNAWLVACDGRPSPIPDFNAAMIALATSDAFPNLDEDDLLLFRRAQRARPRLASRPAITHAGAAAARRGALRPGNSGPAHLTEIHPDECATGRRFRWGTSTE